ncbi:MAG TPA: NepR family anti-sigma factor [Sphingobium sp.]|uniref:NepR family anti-sigma factor n=1 Tax=Sphingobium sp. TaxID=1912891 RepID=UPI002ED68EFF
MNRRVASSNDSRIDEARGEAEIEGGDLAVRSESGESPQTVKSTRQKKQSSGTDAAKRTDKGGKGASGDVGNLLRGAYRQTVDEAIPDDLMDLLNRLE